MLHEGLRARTRQFFAFTVAMLALALGRSIHAQVIFFDDFQSYANTAQLIAPGAWGDNNAANIALSTTLSAAGNPGQGLLAQRSNNADPIFSAQHNIANITPTNAQPLVWSFDFFDTFPLTNKRVTGGFRNTSTSALLEMGWFNAINNPETNTTVSGYGVRTANVGGPTAASGWVTFLGNPTAQAGWHNFKATISASHILFELDFGDNGIVDFNRVVDTTTGGTEIYNVLRLGGPSDLSSAGGGARFDNVNLALFQPTKGLFNTGIGGAGNALLGDAVDPHFTVHRPASAGAPVNTGAGSPTFVVPQDGFPIPPWLASNATSGWISSTQESDGNDAAGFYDYNLSFDMTAFEAANNIIFGRWAVDNTGVDIYLNGQPTGNPNPNGFGTFTDFSLDGFLAGTNVLTFRVQNGGAAANPTGLRVEFLSIVTAPEPISGAVWLGIALPLLGAAWLRRSRRRRHVR